MIPTQNRNAQTHPLQNGRTGKFGITSRHTRRTTLARRAMIVLFFTVLVTICVAFLLPRTKEISVEQMALHLVDVASPDVEKIEIPKSELKLGNVTARSDRNDQLTTTVEKLKRLRQLKAALEAELKQRGFPEIVQRKDLEDADHTRIIELLKRNTELQIEITKTQNLKADLESEVGVGI